MGANTNGDEVQGIRSVDRAVAVLDYLAREGCWCSVSDLAEALDVHKSTVVRLLATLQHHGLVEQDPGSSKYRLGFGVLRLAGAVTDELGFVRQAQPVCEELSANTGESVNIAVLEEDAVVNVAQFLPESSLVSQNWLGRRTPLHCTSTGKVFLAYCLGGKGSEPPFNGGLEQFTERTIRDPDALRRELDEVRALGYACALEELEVGLNAVAAPIRSAQGEVIAAVSVAGPAYRLPVERVPLVGRQTKEATDLISRAIGYRGDI